MIQQLERVFRTPEDEIELISVHVDMSMKNCFLKIEPSLEFSSLQIWKKNGVESQTCKTSRLPSIVVLCAISRRDFRVFGGCLESWFLEGSTTVREAAITTAECYIISTYRKIWK